MFAIGLLLFGVGMFGLGALAVWVLTFGTTVWLGTEEEPSQPLQLPRHMTTNTPDPKAFMDAVFAHRHPITCGMCPWGRSPENHDEQAYLLHMQERHRSPMPGFN